MSPSFVPARPEQQCPATIFLNPPKTPSQRSHRSSSSSRHSSSSSSTNTHKHKRSKRYASTKHPTHISPRLHFAAHGSSAFYGTDRVLLALIHPTGPVFLVVNINSSLADQSLVFSSNRHHAYLQDPLPLRLRLPWKPHRRG